MPAACKNVLFPHLHHFTNVIGSLTLAHWAVTRWGLYQQPQGYRNPVRKIMSEPNLAEEPTFVLQQHTARPAHGVGDSTSESSISHPQPLSRLSGTKVNSDAGDGGQASSAVHEASAEFVAAEAARKGRGGRRGGVGSVPLGAAAPPYTPCASAPTRTCTLLHKV